MLLSNNILIIELMVLAAETFDSNFSSIVKRSAVHYLSLIITPPFGAGWR